MGKLVIAEKPSVAQSIAKVLGAYQRKDGYMEGSGYFVSWCIGHLVELAQPQVYDERYGKWRYSDLPIVPQLWKFEVTQDKKKQFQTLQTLMFREDIDQVVNACDAGREGEAIFRWVYDLTGCQKPMERLWISSMEDSAIRDGFAGLKPGSDYEKLYRSAQCRSKADWLVGINGTRLFSTQYGKKLTVGRVQTPTLAIIVERNLAIKGFKPETYYKVHLCGEELKLTAEGTYDEAGVKEFIKQCQGKAVVILEADSKEKSAKPPKLYDLTTLQREANRYYGFTAQQTLDYTQKLYEAKLVTYPRTDSQYLTEDMAETVMEMLPLLPTVLPYSVKTEPVMLQNIINNGKVTDHHGIIPTKASLAVDLTSLGRGEKAIFLMIVERLLVAISSDLNYLERVIKASCEGIVFVAKGKTVLQEGWTALDKAFKASISGKEVDKEKEVEDDDVIIPSDMVAGRRLTNMELQQSEHITKPPKPFTEDTLLSAMERAGNGDFEKETEKKGLGTPATRASIIEKLVYSGYAERKGKQIFPTENGMTLIGLLPESIKSPQLTAEWENRLLEVEGGMLTDSDFMDGIIQLVEQLIKDYSNVDDGVKRAFQEPVLSEVLGKCPRCGSSVVERKQTFGCTQKSCDFALWKNNRFFDSIGHSLTKKVAIALLKDKGYKAKGLKSKQNGKSYDAIIKLVDHGEKYPSFEMEFMQEQLKSKKKEMER